MSESNGERLEPYKPPFAVWELIKSTVPSKELPLVKSYIGESMIEYCLDLRNELESLLEIWKMVGEQLEPPTITKSLYSDVLPDPPKLREMLTKQIHMLVKCLQEKDGYTNNVKFEDSDKKVIQYAMISQSPRSNSERPSTPLRRRELDNLYTTSPVKLKHIRRNINAIDISAVADIIKDAIKSECKTLENDIEFLQKCVEEEHALASSRPSSPIEEPSIVALRQVCKSLENQTILESSSKVDQTKFSVLPTKLPTPPSPKRIQLKPMAANYRPCSSQVPGGRQLYETPAFYSVPASPLENDKNKFSQFHLSNMQTGLYVTETDGRTVMECWVEPEWSHCMADSPPTTADSGVGSRPATCDLSAIQEKMLSARNGAYSRTFSDASPHTSYESAKGGNGSFRETSNIFSSFSCNQMASKEDEENDELLEIDRKKETNQFSVTPHPPLVFKPIAPHPPKMDGIKLSRPTVNARRLSRKPVNSN